MEACRCEEYAKIVAEYTLWTVGTLHHLTERIPSKYVDLGEYIIARQNQYIARQIWHGKNGKIHDKISISNDKYSTTKMLKTIIMGSNGTLGLKVGQSTVY